MQYITSLFLPSPNFDGLPHRSTRRFCERALLTFDKSVKSALPRLLKGQKILGDDMTVLLDKNLKNFNGGLSYSEVCSSGLNVVEINLKPNGMWNNKIVSCISACNVFDEVVMWMDFMDTCVKNPLTIEENNHIETKLEKVPLVFEWEEFHCYGPYPKNSNGTEKGGRVRQPQTGIFCFKDSYILRKALETKIDHDQIAILHALQNEFGIFQDKINDNLIESFSSNGLIKSLPLRERHKFLSFNFRKYDFKFCHKEYD